jgi:hypothetical protein
MVMLRILLVLATCVAVSAQSGAFTLSHDPNRIYIPVEEGGGGRTELDPDHVWQTLGTHTHGESAKSLIEAGWPDWNVSTSGTGAPGTVTVHEYIAWQQYNSLGQVQIAGAGLVFDYTSTDPSFENYRFVQVIYTNDPLHGATSPYLDPSNRTWDTPFYDPEDERLDLVTGNTYQFLDYPSRSYDGTNTISWAAALWLCEWTVVGGVNHLTIRDGVYWGWKTFGHTGSGGTGSDRHSPVPEPASIMALGAGLLLVARRRKR